MKHISTLFSLLVALTFVTSQELKAQMIWPGDINNNGVVNGIDWLYWGVSHQTVGPVRPNASTDWQEQAMGNSWSQQFPGSMNYAYADVNGDGVVNMDDAAAISDNFRLTHGTLVPDTYGTSTNAAAPAMRFHQDQPLAQPNAEERLLLSIGDEQSPYSTLYGMSFVLEYPPNSLREEGVFFGASGNNFLTAGNGNAITFIENDSANGRAEVTIVRMNQEEVSGFGELGKFVLAFSDLQDPDLPDTLWFRVSDVLAVDLAMNAQPTQGAEFFFLTGGGSGTGPCPNTIDPVCGSNGVTYLNSCYAEAAGIYDYTPGTCFSDDCIDPTQIDSDAVCTTIYEPVCGCNGITYPNECVADAAGVVSTTPGPCPTSSCYDPLYVIVSDATTLNPATGVITVDCTADYNPVCGCNGVTYANACLAEASGITVYTQGTCESVCIDPAQMNPDAVCTAIYDPVCGCNGVTYPNACEADAAGVTTYYSGPCGGTSPWCAEAIPIQCGDFLAYETTVGSGNNITYYPGCSPYAFQGPDRVYTINKTSAGDLQIGLEILTPNLDLDLFLLADNCSQVTCLGKSTTSNNVTNNEGIVLEDAPIGTYYIVVDGQYASSAGAFRLEVSCGYLYCGDAVPLTCGQPYYGNNGNGEDNVSLYGCEGNVLNVENNGPEMVHTFTVTEAGPVTVSLSNLDANLELFLLRSCDRGDCIEYSQHPGTNNESITHFLEPGTYYVVVDGYNGAVSDYTLVVDCANNCDFTIASLSATPSGCGQSSGSINITTAGGSPNYLVTYSGPLNGSFTTGANSCTIYNLPPGTYVVTKTDYQGCSVTGTVTILGGSNLSANLVPNDAVCMDAGSIDVTIYNGNAPYTIYVNGPTSGTVTSNYNNFTINNLAAGDYTIHITDASGCSISQQVTIDHSSGNFIWNYTVTPANCGTYGAIHINTYNGDAPYNVWVAGPVTGGAVVYAPSFNIIDLPGGVYEVTVEDDNWCLNTQTVIIPDANMTIGLSAIGGVCGADGGIQVNVSNGSPYYTISWNGPESGSTTTNDDNYIISGLPSGSYTVSVQDAAGCTDYEAITLTNGEADGLSVNVVPLDGDCNQYGALWIDIYNGNPYYTISWTGPQSGSLTTSDDGLDIPNLLPGCYTVTITDSNGCSTTVTVCINGGGDLDINLNPQAGICGQPGSIFVTINGGSPAYAVSWNGPVSGSTNSVTNNVNIPGLPTGTYTVNVSDSQGCTDYAVTQVTSAESNLYLQTNVSESTCALGGTIGLYIGGGVGPYQVSWSGPESGNLNSNNSAVNITDLASGTYNIYVTDGNGCSESTQATINNSNSDLEVSLVGNNGICSQYGNIGVYVSMGTGPYLISWSGPISGSASSVSSVYQIQNTPAGTYNVVVTDANGCTASDYVTVSSVNQLQAIVTAFNGECGSSGSIQVDVTQGTPDYTITWSGPQNGSVTTSSDWYTISGLPSGTYTVVVTDANGCTQTYVRTVSNTEGDLQLQTALIYNICGQYNTIWVDIFGGTGPYTVSWQGPENGSATTTTNGYEIMDLPPGTYKVIVVDANGCMVMEQGIVIYPSPIDLFTLIPNNGLCGEPGSIQVNITGGTPNYIISWNGPVSGTQTATSMGVQTFANLPGGTYTFTVTDVNGCTESETATINNGIAPIQIITSLIYNECGQYNTIWVDIIGGTGPYTVSWQGPQNGSATTTTNGYEILDLPPGTYKVIVVDANGCMVMEQGIIIYPAPVELFSVTPIPGICGQTGQVQINVTGGTPNYTVSWTGPVNGSVQVNPGLQNLSGFPSGAYVFTLTDANGCTETETVTLDNNIGGIDIITSLVYNECGQYNIIWVDIIGGTGPYTVTWQGGANGSGTTNTNGFEIMDLPPGSYKVTVIDANGCMVMQQGIVVYPAPVDLFTATPINGICSDPGSILVTITNGTPNYTLSWNGPVSSSITVGGGSVTIPNLPSGTYTINLIDVNGCTEVEVVTVTSSENDVDIAAYGNNGNCLEDASITVQAQGGTPNYTLTWTGPESGSTVIGSNPFTIPDLMPGVYTVSIADANGCDDQAFVQVMNVEDDLGLSLIPQPGTCGVLGSIGVSLAGGTPSYTVSWTGPSSGSVSIAGQYVSIPNLSSGVYTITVTDSNGCSQTMTAGLYNSDNNLVVTATPINGDCGSLGSANVSISGGSSPYTVSWNGPANGSATINGNFVNIPNLPSGTYSIVVSGDCSTSTTVTINNTENDLTVYASPVNGDCGQLGSANVSISGGSAPYTVSWNGPVSGSTNTNSTFINIPNLPSGTYSILVSGGGCSTSTTVTINNIEDNLNIYVSPNNGSCGSEGSISVNLTGATGSTVISWSGPESGSTTINGNSTVIPNLSSGAYTVTATNGNCSDATLTMVSNTEDDLAVYATPYNGACGANGYIVVTWSGGQAPYTVSWNGPVAGSSSTNGTSFTIPNLPAGTYSISVSGGGCNDTATATLTNNQNNIYVTATPNDAPCNALASIDVSISGGSAPYIVSWSGPVTGSESVNGSFYQIVDLPGGTYIVTVQDANGCSNGTTTSVEQGGFEITLTGIDGTCGDNTTIQVSMQNGTAPYTVSWTDGILSGSALTYNLTYDIVNLPGSTYTVTVTDNESCSDSGVVTLESGPTDLVVVHTVGNNGCGAYSNIWMDFYNGVGPYTVIWSGPTEGSITTPDPFYDITNVPSGTYIVTIIDGQGCVDTQIVLVNNLVDDFDVDFSAVNGSCGANGAISLHLSGGLGPYEVIWYQNNNPLGWVNISQNNYTITDLPSGTYHVRVTDTNGCEESANVTLNNSATTLNLQITSVAPGCSNTGSIGIIMGGGQAPYTVSWSGPENGNDVTNNANYLITGLAGGDYNIQVVDANGCTGYAIVNLPGGAPGTITADYSYYVDGLTVDFTNQSNAGSYTWTFGDGTSSSNNHPEHTFAGPGTYTVCLTVSAVCGSDTYCHDITVTTDDDLALLDVGNGDGGPGSTVQVPVYVHNLSNLISLAGSFQVENEEVGIITGVTPGLIAPQFNTTNLTFSYYNNNGSSLNLGTNNVLFYLNVELVGEIGETTTIAFHNSPLPIEVGSMVNFIPSVIPYTLSPGTVSITNMGSLDGQVMTFWDEGIMEAEVLIAGPDFTETMMTTEDGHYSLPELALGQEYTVSATKDNMPENGLSTYALFIGQRFLLGMNPPQITSPYQVIAGDANCSDAFTTLDLFLIQRLIIGADNEFANCPSWVFVAEDSNMPTDFDAYNVFPYSTASTMMVMENETANFVGVKVGDILGDASPDNFGGTEEDDRNNEALEFQAPNLEVAMGEEVTLYFQSSNFADIVSYQFGLTFDEDQVEFLEFIPAEDEPFQTVVAGTTNAAHGQLRVSWFSLDGVGHSSTQGQPLFGLRFRALTDVTDWTELLSVDPAEMLAEAYTSNEVPMNPTISFSDVTSTVNPGATPFELYQNTPNPFKNETIIGFNLPEASDATLLIRDALGKEVMTINGNYGAGFQTIRLTKDLPAGVYHYTLRAGLETATRTMIVIK